MDAENKNEQTPEGDNTQDKAKPDGDNSKDLGGDLNELKNKIAFLEKETKEIIAQRDKLKNEKRKADESEAVKKGEIEKLLSEKNIELENSIKEIESLKSYKDKYDSLDKKIRADLLNQLNDEHKKLAKDLPTEILTDYVKLNSTSKNGMDAGKTGRGAIDTTNKKWSDFDSVQLDSLRKDSPDAYKKLYREQFKREIAI